MHFKVSGVDQISGRDREVVVVADNEPTAAAKAKEQGIFAYRVTRDRASEAREEAAAQKALCDAADKISEQELRQKILKRKADLRKIA
jgi:type II secretory pathway component PulF